MSDAKRTRDQAHRTARRINDHLDTILVWLGSRTADNTPPRWRPEQAHTGKQKGRVSRPTEARALLVSDTLQHVTDRLVRVADDLDGRAVLRLGAEPATLKHPSYGDTRYQPRLRIVTDSIRENAQLLAEACDTAYRGDGERKGGATSEDLTAYTWPLGDAEGTLFHCVRQYGMTPVRRCRAGCGAAAPPKGQGATCGRCRTAKWRDSQAGAA